MNKLAPMIPAALATVAKNATIVEGLTSSVEQE
jgi:hypothetical protein